MNEYLSLLIWVIVIGTAFGVAWYLGYLKKTADYVQETREELKKCTWPSMQELKGSTVVVMLTIILLGLFTVGIDFVFTFLVRWIT
ncbi:MAG: preprotein translocase subunit SecE [Candidatus Omnitrophica bacterium]|nr:preprotein translocase subunit SecE [Candidatus Omnitrophota bacterium]